MGHVLAAVARMLSRGGNTKDLDWEQFYRTQQQHDQQMRNQQKKRAVEKL